MPQARKPYHTFAGPDGANPRGALIRDSAGNLYGTAANGGAWGNGVVFRLDPDGQLTVLYNFIGGMDGAAPLTGVVRDPAGNLYGTTWAGGAANDGVVYKLDRKGQATTLYSFTVSNNGFTPPNGLLRDPAGNLYGVTPNGGTSNAGTIYEIDPAGKFTVLYNFGGDDGMQPAATLIRDRAGNLFGTAMYGGTANLGVVFKLDPAAKLTVLYNFKGGKAGGIPSSGLLRDQSGNLYGTTTAGAATGQGAVYKLAITKAD